MRLARSPVLLGDGRLGRCAATGVPYPLEDVPAVGDLPAKQGDEPAVAGEVREHSKFDLRVIRGEQNFFRGRRNARRSENSPVSSFPTA